MIISVEESIKKDLEIFKKKGGEIEYPLDVEDFAMRVFGLDIHYEDFNTFVDEKDYNPQDFLGCLYPDGRYFYGMDKVIVINTNRAPFYLWGKEIDEAFYKTNSDRQTIAHEIGHYSDKFFHNQNNQKELFGNLICLDSSASILIYPKNSETFANKYSRLLLMPEKKIHEIIIKNNIHGTIDLRSYINLFTDTFGVTQFMVEHRLKELKIHFNNGVYYWRKHKQKNEKYTKEDLLVLIDIAKKYDFKPDYHDADAFVKGYNMTQGQYRASGPLYMVINRILKGEYDEKHPEVFEKRIAELAEFESKERNPK